MRLEIQTISPYQADRQWDCNVPTTDLPFSVNGLRNSTAMVQCGFLQPTRTFVLFTHCPCAVLPSSHSQRVSRVSMAGMAGVKTSVLVSWCYVGSWRYVVSLLISWFFSFLRCWIHVNPSSKLNKLRANMKFPLPSRTNTE
jgi:hypothetical protein